MNVTLKHIAEEVGVSQSLVTFALNGKPGVSEAKRLEIQQAAVRMGYDRSANRAAHALAARRHGSRVATGTIALIFPLLDDIHWSSIPFHRALIDGMESETARRGLDALIMPTRGQEVPRIISEGRVDGLIFITGISSLNSYFGNLNQPGISLCAPNPSTYSLIPDNEAGSYQATTHLIELGHRRIAFLGMDGRGQSKARLQGYNQALAEHGLLSEGDFTQVVENSVEIHGREGMEALLHTHRRGTSRKPDFTALVCQNDLIAMGAIRRAEEAGLSIPEDLSVVGFDDVSLQYGFTPAVTSIAFDRFEMARRSVDLLCQDVKSLMEFPGDQSQWQRRLGTEKFPTTLVVRDSTSPPLTRGPSPAFHEHLKSGNHQM